jgi:hypothetical protein
VVRAVAPARRDVPAPYGWPGGTVARALVGPAAVLMKA